MTDTPLWTSDDAIAATGGSCDATWQATGVSIDSRTVAPGDLFIAIKGDRLDGHAYVAGAFEKGAAAAIVSDPDAVGEAGGPLLVVDDTFDALNALGAAARQRTAAKIVAITGSVGKTSVKEALRFVLDRQRKTVATLGNLNNHWGAPLSLARMPKDVAYGVFELGMNHAGELTPLSKLVRPHVGLITTIAPAHFEFFETVADIADAKAEIFAGMPGGVAILNRDNAYFPMLAVAAYACRVERIIGFGAHPDATTRVIEAQTDSNGSDIKAEIDGRALTYRIGQPGRHWVINSLAVLAAVAAVGADLDQAARDLADIPAAKGRGERIRVPIEGGFVDIIDDSYNASPAAMRAAFETLAAIEPGDGGRRIAVLGDMLELGEDAPRLHAALAAALVERGIDLVFTAGPNMAHLADALPADRHGGHARESTGLKSLVCNAVRPGDLVTVKGSLGSKMKVIVDALEGMRVGPAEAANG